MQSEITQIVKEGLKNGYDENIVLLTWHTNYINTIREYLLTVNVAQKLLEWNKNYNYQIQIEYPIKLFYSNAFVSSRSDMIDIFKINVIERLSDHSPTSQLYQKIDIAITKKHTGDNASEHELSVVGIELKGINKKELEIIRDANRLAKAMILKDEVSKNSIEFCFCGFLRRFDKNEEMVTELTINNYKSQENATWNKVCSDLNAEYKALNFSIEFFDIAKSTLEKVSNVHTEMESEYSEVARDTGIVIGCILVINRK